MNILVKFPVRGRTAKFFETLRAYREGESGEHVVQYVITMDDDDVAMNTAQVREALDAMPRLGYRYSRHDTKVEAINADLDLADPHWQVCVLASDDMVPEVAGWDDVIAKDMSRSFADGDGCLWYFDGYCRVLCTLSILGRPYFDRLGYIYHPEYISLWCDNEHTEVAKRAGKLKFIDKVIIRHKHHIHGHGPRDRLLDRNESFYHKDKATFERRQKAGFP